MISIREHFSIYIEYNIIIPLYGRTIIFDRHGCTASSSLTSVVAIGIWITSIFERHESIKLSTSSSLTLVMTIVVWITSIFDEHESTGSSSPTLVVAIAI